MTISLLKYADLVPLIKFPLKDHSCIIHSPVSISHFVENPSLAFISGISSQDPLFRYFAYSELQTLASSSTPSLVTQRVALFNEGGQKYNPHLWTWLVRESLLLGRDYQLFLRRGKPVARVNRTRAAIVEKIDKMCALMGLLSISELSRNLRLWWSEERISESVAACVPNKEVDIAVVNGTCIFRFHFPCSCVICIKNVVLMFVCTVLSYLTCASLKEDKYGIVQKAIRRILDTMLSFLSAVEEYHAQVRAMYEPPVLDEDKAQTYTLKELQAKENLRIEVEKGLDELRYLADA